MRITTYAYKQSVVPVVPRSVEFGKYRIVAKLLSGQELTLPCRDFIWLSKSKGAWSLCFNERVEVSGVSDLEVLSTNTLGYVELRQRMSKTVLVVNPKHHKKYKE